MKLTTLYRLPLHRYATLNFVHAVRSFFVKYAADPMQLLVLSFHPKPEA